MNAMTDVREERETAPRRAKTKLLWAVLGACGALAFVVVLGASLLREPDVAARPEAASAVAAPDTDVVATPKAKEAAAESIGTGTASFYGPGLAGNPTASGETFDPKQLTAAHRTLPFDSRVRVTNTANGRSVVVRINDRGPFAKGRIIDVSKAAAQQLGMVEKGTAPVRLELLPTSADAP